MEGDADFPPKGVLIAAPRSGSGKTTLSLGLMAALTARGLKVQPFKCGPDYIDPAFHTAVTGRRSFNLDGWCMDAARMRATVAAAAVGSDIVVAEALMGLYDGVARPGAAGDGSSAGIAALFGWPVVVVLDVSGQSQTAGALALGMARFSSAITVAGVVLNRVGSERHARLARQGVEAAGLTVLGALPRLADLGLKERHLGLVQAGEIADLGQRLARLGEIVAGHVDLDRVIAAAAAGPGGPVDRRAFLPPPGQRIALARDAAFSFVYPHVLEGWRAAGAEIVPFSPLADEAPAGDADAVWLPGGYPELHAGRIAAAGRFLAGLTAAAARGAVHGECGGFMVLGEELVDGDGVGHAMAGLLPLATSYRERRLHLGYRLARMLGPSIFGPAGQRVRGHEFHYSRVLRAGTPALAAITDADGGPVAEGGLVAGRVSGTFFHAVAVA